jgi:indole-3-glycerol phosphate synthase
MEPSLRAVGNPNKNRSKVTRTLTETQGHDGLPGILARIVRTKRDELARLRPRSRELEAALDDARAPRGMASALGAAGTVSLIAECKRRSPGAGAIRPDLDPVELARGYEGAGASAVSVLTDETYFGGSLDDLRSIGDAIGLPGLRKDFTLDPLHVVEARGAGADAVLLIVRILDDPTLRSLHDEAVGLGMDVLVEVHDRRELERALGIGAKLLGINNRDLATFTTDLATTEALVEVVPDDVVVVSESGIRDRDDVVRLGRAGVDAILVGESLLRADDPARAAGTLTGVPVVRRVRG